jgi:hypothetical protein
MFHPENVGKSEQAAFNEATRLWDSQDLAPIPANISAGLLIHQTMVSDGQDRLGRHYIEEAMDLALESGLFTPSRAQQMYDETQPEQLRQRAEFAWAIYSHHGFVMTKKCPALG